MGNRQVAFLGFLCLTVIFITSCAKEEGLDLFTSSELNLPETPFKYKSINLPSHFRNNVPRQMLPTSVNGLYNTPSDNPITDGGATLGSVIYYETKLSANGTISCASYHEQAKGFSDDDVLSMGFDGGMTARHSMTSINARFYQRCRFFWDERASTLEEPVLESFQDLVEMGMTLDEVVSTIRSQSYYPELFEKAFESEEVSADRISKA